MAEEVSTWSKDPSTKCGAVITRPDNSLVSVGFNGFPRGILDSERRLNDKDYKYEIILHDADNAIFYANGQDLTGCSMYTFPFGPCGRCAARIIQQGIKRVLFPKAAEDKPIWAAKVEIAKKMFAETDISFFEKQ